jgi:uncharacterized membrane protein
MDRRTTTVALGIGALGIAAATLGRKRKDVARERASGSRSVTVRCEARRLYLLWQCGDPLPEVFRGERDVEIIDSDPGKRLEWRNLQAVPFGGGGSLTFLPAPGTRGTELRLSVYLEGPGARAAAAFRRAFGASPAQIAMESLRAFKALAEAGETPKAVRA